MLLPHLGIHLSNTDNLHNPTTGGQPEKNKRLEIRIKPNIGWQPHTDVYDMTLSL